MNESKEVIEQIVEAHWEEQWEHIKAIDLPDTREHEAKESRLINEIKSLQTRELKDKTNSEIIHKFFPSIMTANRGGRLSPVEYWKKLQNEPETFKKFYTNRLSRSDWFNEKPENKKALYEGKVPDFIYAIGLTTGHFAEKVSIFKPACAKNLLNKYAPEAESVIDSFSGYGARLIGALVTGKTYIGYDINDITVNETNNLIKWLEEKFPEFRGKAKVGCRDVFATTGEADVYLSCPPYARADGSQIEEWMSSTGKITCTKTNDEIIDYVLKNYNCKKYIFVFDAGDSKYKEFIKEHLENVNYINARKGELTNASHNYESVIVITKEERDLLIKG